MKNNILQGLLIIALLSSCGGSKLLNKPVIKAKKLEANSYYLIPTDATLKTNVISTKADGSFRMLSEVSPDAIVTSVVDLTTKLNLKLRKGDSLSAEQLVTITQSATELGKRTASVNILRDALFRIEEYNHNGHNNDTLSATYKLFVKVLEAATAISMAEFENERAKANKAETEKQVQKTKQLEIEKSTSEMGDKNVKAKYELASKYENEAFTFLLNDQIEEAILGFEKVETTYPTFHNAYEIIKLLTKNKSQLLKSTIDDNAKKIFQTIYNSYSWGMTEEMKKQLNEKAKKLN